MRRRIAMERALHDLRRPARLIADAWPAGRAGRRVAAVLAPFVVVSAVAVLWVIGVVALSALGAVGLAPVDLGGSDHYLRDGVLFVGTGSVVVLAGTVGASVWRTAADEWSWDPLSPRHQR